MSRGRMICVRGEMMTISDAARRFRISRNTIWMRLSRGYTAEEAVGTENKTRGPEPVPARKKHLEALIRSEDEREARAMMKLGRRDAEIAEWLGWDLARVAALRNQESAA